jgi:hypothetical protein
MGCGELARVYSRQGRLKEAVELCKRTVTLLEVSRGIEHPDSVYALWKLAQLYRRQQDTKTAIKACEMALTRALGRLTDRHPLYAKIASELRSLQAEALDEAGLADKVEHSPSPPKATTWSRRLEMKSRMTW